MFLGVNFDPANAWVTHPPEDRIVPKQGAWCIIQRQLPPMERGIDKLVTVGRVFWMEHVSSNCDEEGFQPDGTYSVLAKTPFGEPRLFPYEYKRVSIEFLMEMTQAGGYSFTPMALGETFVNDVVFYAMARGIPRPQAMEMALGSLSGPVGWFDSHPDLLGYIDAISRMGRPITQVNRDRRAAARRARRSTR